MQMPVLGVLCEDDHDELHRRGHQLLVGLGLNFTPHQQLDQFQCWSRVGHDNFLLKQQMGSLVLTPFYSQVKDQLASMSDGPKLLILDTLADLFGGNEIERVQANYFVKTALGGICQELNTTVLLLAHPSQAGKSSGDLLSGSTAWNNSVRSRLSIDWVRNEQNEPDPDYQNSRVIKRPKSNYAQARDEIEVEYDKGVFKVSSRNYNSMDKSAIARAIQNEIVEKADLNMPYSISNRAERAVRKMRIEHDGKRVPSYEIEAQIQYLIQEKRLEVRERTHSSSAGLYEGETQ